MKTPVIVESDKSRVWRITIIFLLCAAVVIGIASIAVYLEYERQFDRTAMYLEFRTQNLDADSAREHCRATYDWSQDTNSSVFDDAVGEYPEGTLFHYKSSAEGGYAIVDRGRIVWRRAMFKH